MFGKLRWSCVWSKYGRTGCKSPAARSDIVDLDANLMACVSSASLCALACGFRVAELAANWRVLILRAFLGYALGLGHLFDRTRTICDADLC